MRNQSGQVILLLILVMTVALAIGLSIVQRSLVDVSTASKVEQSSRAFSAAEAGIEKALQLQPGSTCGVDCISFSENSSKADVEGGSLMPCVPGQPTCSEVTDTQLRPFCVVGQPSCPEATDIRQLALEFPLLVKEDIAQVWLADYKSTLNPPASFYTQNTLDVYWGNSSSDLAALELTLVYYGTDASDPVDPSSSKYRSKKWYLDQTNRGNGFEVSCGNSSLAGYQCNRTLSFTVQQASGLMLLRARLLYNTTSQPFAVQAVGTCGKSCSLPPQAKSIISTGTSGETQRRVKVFQLDKVVPQYFDYAIFSAGEIAK